MKSELGNKKYVSSGGKRQLEGVVNPAIAFEGFCRACCHFSALAFPRYDLVRARCRVFEDVSVWETKVGLPAGKSVSELP